MSFGDGNLHVKCAELEAKLEAMPRTWDECRACQDAHDRALFNARERENLLAHMVETRNESIHYLVKLLDKRQWRIAELERMVERYQKRADMLEEYIEGPQGWRASCSELTTLVRDMWKVVQYPYICVDDEVLHERMKELGIEAE